MHDDLAHNLLAQEIADLYFKQAGLLVLVDAHVDGEMCVYVSHLVLVATGYTDNQVVDQRADGTERGDAFARAVVEFDGDALGRRLGEGDGKVLQVFDQFAW